MRPKRIVVGTVVGWLLTIMFLIGSVVGDAANQQATLIVFSIATAISAIISTMCCIKWFRSEPRVDQEMPPAYDFV